MTDPAEDLALLTDMRRGHAAAFEALYRRHQAPLYRFALLRCGSPDTAADIVQEIFMGLLANTFKFDPSRGVLQGFLFGVARNLLLKREEAQFRFVPRSRADGEEDENPDDLVVDPAPQPAQRMLDTEQAEAVWRALQKLAPHYRDVVILYEMHDLSYVEIAQICHIDLGTVRSRLSRARAKLVELLQPEFPETLAAAPHQTHPHPLEARP
ncbi:MAG: RNA polymerase sigma factor [Betaproteobacteria bacterium]